MQKQFEHIEMGIGGEKERTRWRSRTVRLFMYAKQKPQRYKRGSCAYSCGYGALYHVAISYVSSSMVSSLEPTLTPCSLYSTALMTERPIKFFGFIQKPQTSNRPNVTGKTHHNISSFMSHQSKNINFLFRRLQHPVARVDENVIVCRMLRHAS